MKSKRKAAVLLIVSVMCLSIIFAPSIAASHTGPLEYSPLHDAQREIVERFAERVVNDESVEDTVDPLLRTYMMTGALDESAVTTTDGDVKVLLYLAPEANYQEVKTLVTVRWRADLKIMSVVSADVKDTTALKQLEVMPGVRFIQADRFLDPIVTDYDELDTELDLFSMRDVVGATAADVTYGYDGSGVVVAVDDSGADFSDPDMKGAHHTNATGFPSSFDPSSYGYTEMYLANRTAVSNVTAWLEAGNLLTYESKGKYYLNVTGWDPVTNNQGGHRPLLGLNAPYGNGGGFIGLYEGAWGGNNVSEFVYNEMWRDWEIPAPGVMNYTFGWVFQQRDNTYAKVFSPAMIYEGDVVIDWNGTLAWTSMWNWAIRSQTSAGFAVEIDLNTTTDRDLIADIMDWSFTDDIAEGYEYNVGTGNEPVLSADLDDDGYVDIGLGSLCWAYDSLGFLSVTDEELFCGISSDNMAFALMFPSDTAHGHWCTALVGSRGVYDHDVYDNTTTYKLPGVATGSNMIAVKGLSSGGGVAAEFWAAGFHLAADGNFTYQPNMGHKAHIISNSWSYVGGARLDLTYLTLSWDLMSTPEIIDASYPGTLFFFSAGNAGTDHMTSSAPNDAISVVSVGGVIVNHYYEDIYGPGQAATKAQDCWFASKGPHFFGMPKPDIVSPAFRGVNDAPFHNVWTQGGDSYQWWSGTSLATPIAAGVSAIILEAMLANGWTYDPLMLKNILMSSATDLGYDGFVQGHGLINAEATVAALDAGTGGEFIFQSDSFKYYSELVDDAWDYWMPDWAPFNVWQDASLTDPIGLETSSIFFGALAHGETAEVNLTTWGYDKNLYDSADFDAVNAYYWVMDKQITVDLETYLYNDTNFVTDGEYLTRGGWFKLEDELGTSDYSDIMAAPFVTMTIGYDSDYTGEIFAFLFDWEDDTNGQLNYWNSTTGNDNDTLYLVSRDDNGCNMLTMRLAHDAGIGNLFMHNPTLRLHDISDNVNFTHGNDVHVSFTLWKQQVDAAVHINPYGSGDYTNVTLEVPMDAEYGIHQGLIEVTEGGWSHVIPYSYMVGFTLDTAENVPKTLVDTWGDELTPYESGALWAGFNTYENSEMEFGGYRTFKIEIPDDYPTQNRSILVIRTEWQNADTIVDVYLHATTYHALHSSDDGGFDLAQGGFLPTPTEPTKNTLVYDPGGLINDTYYLRVGAHRIDGSDIPENITITLQWFADLAQPTIDPLYYSDTESTPAVFDDGDTLTGDHVTVNNTFALDAETNFPEYSIQATQMSFLSGLYVVRTGLVPDPQGTGAWPIPLDQTDLYLWETVDGIAGGDTVRISLAMNADPSFDVYEWIDANDDDEVQLDELVTPALASVDDGGADYTEIATFVAPNDMSIAIRVYSWAWVWDPGDTYTLEVDTRVSIDVENVEGMPSRTSYDTYDFLRNATMTVIFTMWTYTDVYFEINLGDVTFENYFSPEITSIEVTGSGLEKTVSWTYSDMNAGDEHFFEVLLSADDGVSFQLLRNNLTTTSFMWDSGGFLNQSYRFMVRVYDNDPVQNPDALATNVFWMGLSDSVISDSFNAGDVVVTTPTTTPPTTTPPPPTEWPIDPLWIGLLAGIGVGVVVVLIIFLVKKR